MKAHKLAGEGGQVEQHDAMVVGKGGQGRLAEVPDGQPEGAASWLCLVPSCSQLQHNSQGSTASG